jgi:hypothetical protein
VTSIFTDTLLSSERKEEENTSRLLKNPGVFFTSLRHFFNSVLKFLWSVECADIELGCTE